jgi:hypothetical protein
MSSSSNNPFDMFNDDIPPPHVTIRKEKETQEKEKEKEKETRKQDKICPICHDKIKKNNSTITQCGHRFHSSCIFKSVTRHNDVCPLCRKHLFKKELTMRELYEVSKDTIFDFEAFCFLINVIATPNIEQCITDYDKYEDNGYEEDDDNEEDDETEYSEESIKFKMSNYSKNFVNKMNELLDY